MYVTAAGRLGVLASSERYKTAVEPMGANTAKLGQLRPVTFKLKTTDAEGTVQYGLIAEEVDKVYPELVIRDEAGKIQGVRYDELAPMLLNEVQKQAAEIRDLKQQVAKVNDLAHELTEMRSALTALQSKDQLVAQRNSEPKDPGLVPGDLALACPLAAVHHRPQRVDFDRSTEGLN